MPTKFIRPPFLLVPVVVLLLWGLIILAIVTLGFVHTLSLAFFGSAGCFAAWSMYRTFKETL